MVLWLKGIYVCVTIIVFFFLISFFVLNVFGMTDLSKFFCAGGITIMCITCLVGGAYFGMTIERNLVISKITKQTKYFISWNGTSEETEKSFNGFTIVDSSVISSTKTIQDFRKTIAEGNKLKGLPFIICITEVPNYEFDTTE